MIVDDYDRAISFVREAFGFELREDVPATTTDGRSKRWVVVAPPTAETGIVLAVADKPSQIAAVGTQFAGRVGLFLDVGDVEVAAARAIAAGCEIVQPRRDESYGSIIVIRDIWGNLWDLRAPAHS
ncbi:VOC family protein [Flexivirga meconopsidis]|uniref:VOC family protein n=1 Tax=Flexivirga meconopsidis TaxID=2977121 RepID=UPI0022400B0B|nr:VOC family protein [Flexivirga meconopsidis]